MAGVMILFAVFFSWYGIGWLFRTSPVGSSPDNPYQGASADAACHALLATLLTEDTDGVFVKDRTALENLRHGFELRRRAEPDASLLSRKELKKRVDAGMTGRSFALSKLDLLDQPDVAETVRETLTNAVDGCQARFEKVGLPPTKPSEPTTDDPFYDR